jgi:hypothetical protein
MDITFLGQQKLLIDLSLFDFLTPLTKMKFIKNYYFDDGWFAK